MNLLLCMDVISFGQCRKLSMDSKGRSKIIEMHIYVWTSFDRIYYISYLLLFIVV